MEMPDAELTPQSAPEPQEEENPAAKDAISPEPIEACEECGAEAPNHQASCSHFVG